MGTTRLTFSNLKPTHIILSPDNLVQDFEVPEGESAFCVFQELAGSASKDEYELRFHLRHPDSQLLVKGLVIARGESTPFLKTSAIHHAPNTRAETLIRTLAHDQAQPHYQGLIDIAKKAHNVESYLNHHSLLLGANAKSWTLPSLQIRADQVKCSHAATMRTVQDVDLFYARSRGLNYQQAKDLFIEAFLADVRECQKTTSLLKSIG